MSTAEPRVRTIEELWNDVLFLDEIGLKKPAGFPADLFVQRHQEELDDLTALAWGLGYPSAHGYVHAVRSGLEDPPDWEGLGLRNWQA